MNNNNKIHDIDHIEKLKTIENSKNINRNNKYKSVQNLRKSSTIKYNFIPKFLKKNKIFSNINLKKKINISKTIDGIKDLNNEIRINNNKIEENINNQINNKNFENSKMKIFKINNNINLYFNSKKYLGFIKNKDKVILKINNNFSIYMTKSSKLMSLVCFSNYKFKFKVYYKFKNDKPVKMGFIKEDNNYKKYNIYNQNDKEIFNCKKVFEWNGNKYYFNLKKKSKDYKIFWKTNSIIFNINIFSSKKKFLIIFLFYLIIEKI